jgi:hypothetical protein
VSPREGLDLLEKRNTLFLSRIEPGILTRPPRSPWRILRSVILNSCSYLVSLRAPLDKLIEKIVVTIRYCLIAQTTVVLLGFIQNITTGSFIRSQLLIY